MGLPSPVGSVGGGLRKLARHAASTAAVTTAVGCSKCMGWMSPAMSLMSILNTSARRATAP